jgi:glycosyltransferase involved in cell wall biosynthesis
LLSVVMVSYNQGRYIAEAIDSFLAQTYAERELIIVDDGSTDGSLDIIAGYLQRFPGAITLLRHENGANRGIAESYRLGISAARGVLIGFLEADDVWDPSNVEVKVKALERSGAGLVYSDAKPIGDLRAIEQRASTLRLLSSAAPDGPFDAFSRLCVINFIPSFSLVIAGKEFFEELLFITDTRFAMGLDWFLWLQVSLRTKFLYLPGQTVMWRLHEISYYNRTVLRMDKASLIRFGLGYRCMVMRDGLGAMRMPLMKKIPVLLTFMLGMCRRTIMELQGKA